MSDELHDLRATVKALQEEVEHTRDLIWRERAATVLILRTLGISLLAESVERGEHVLLCDLARADDAP